MIEGVADVRGGPSLRIIKRSNKASVMKKLFQYQSRLTSAPVARHPRAYMRQKEMAPYTELIGAS